MVCSMVRWTLGASPATTRQAGDRATIAGMKRSNSIMGLTSPIPRNNGALTPVRTRPIFPSPIPGGKWIVILAYWQADGRGRLPVRHGAHDPAGIFGVGRSSGRAKDGQNAFFFAEAYDDDPNKVPPMGSSLPKHVMETLIDTGFDAVYDDPSYKTGETDLHGSSLGERSGCGGEKSGDFLNTRYVMQKTTTRVRLAAPRQWGGGRNEC